MTGPLNYLDIVVFCAKHILHNNLPVSVKSLFSVLPSADMTPLGKLYVQPNRKILTGQENPH